MYRRPWPIVIFAALLIFVEPVLNVFFDAHAGEMAPFSLFCVLGPPIIMGAAVYSMRKWSYSVFVVCSCVTLLRSFVVIQAAEGDQALATALFLVNVALVSYFLMPAVRAPFLDSRLRWWETERRYLVTLNGRVDHENKNAIESTSCQVRDLSAGGAFISMSPGTPLTEGQLIRIRFSPNNRHILSVQSKVVFQRPLEGDASGYGLQFIETTAVTRSMIRDVIRGLHAAGCPSRDPDLTAWQDFVVWSQTLLATGHGLLPQKSQPKSRRANLSVEPDSTPTAADSNSTDQAA
jgi:hypothetical protein